VLRTSLTPRVAYTFIDNKVIFGGGLLTNTREPSKYPDFVPTTFSELFDHYYSYVSTLVFKSGIDDQNVEDVTMSILSKFFENDVLSDFNPDFTSHYNGITRKAVFRTFLSGFVKIYVRHYRDRQQINKQRSAISADALVCANTAGGSTSEVTWMELNGPSLVDTYDDLETTDLINTVRTHLQQMSKTKERCPLTALFEATLVHANLYGKPMIDILAEQFEVSETTVRNRLSQLRSQIHEVCAE